MEALRKDTYYTYADYASWDTDDRYELIDGIPYLMSPAPATKHQKISSELHGQLYSLLKGKPCEVFAAPFDVRLNAAGDNDDTVVQPDIVVVCDKSKLDEKGCNGAPDMVVEILSPTTAGHDRILKFKQYLKAGVREYWIVDPENKDIMVHILENGKYVTYVYSEQDTIPVYILDGCAVDLKEVFGVE